MLGHMLWSCCWSNDPTILVMPTSSSQIRSLICCLWLPSQTSRQAIFNPLSLNIDPCNCICWWASCVSSIVIAKVCVCIFCLCFCIFICWWVQDVSERNPSFRFAAPPLVSRPAMGQVWSKETPNNPNSSFHFRTVMWKSCPPLLLPILKKRSQGTKDHSIDCII